MARGPTIVFTAPAMYITTSTTPTQGGAANTYDVSTWFRSVQLDINADEKEDTTFGLTAKSRVQGLFDWAFESEAVQDYASTGIQTAMGLDNLMYDLLNTKAKFNIFVRPANTAVTSDNPEYGGPVRLFSHRPVGGAVGDVLMTPLSFKGSGNFTRRIS
jgi:hypothetical protein